MHVTEWDRIQEAKTLSGHALRSRAEADGAYRRMLATLFEFWQLLPDEFFSTRMLADESTLVLDLTPYLPPQTNGHTVEFVRMPGYQGLALLTRDGFHETIPDPLEHALRSDLYQFDAGRQAQDLCPQLSVLEGIDRRGRA